MTPSRFTGDAVARLPGPPWLVQARQAAFERFGGSSLPSESEEVWRYSRIDDLDLEAYAPASGRAVADPLPAEAVGVLAGVGQRAGLVVARDGHVTTAELDPAWAAKGLVVGRLSDAPDGAGLYRSIAGAPDALVELAGAFVVDPVLVHVPAGLVVEEPLVVVHWVGTDGGAVFPHTLVRLEEGAQASVVEVVASGDLAALVGPVVELEVGEGAALGYVGIQQLGRRVWQTAYQASRVAREGRLVSFGMALGGHYARLRTDSALVGQGAEANLLAAYFGDGDQMHDFRTMQDHDAPNTTSDLLFKGAVAGVARSVYSGLIRVRRGAHGTNAFQTNRNLVLSAGAHADSVPNLDIAENDVRCSHASAVGPVDPEQRYYLESRGVPPAVADRLIVLGFFDDILARLPVPSLARPQREAVAAKLTSPSARPGGEAAGDTAGGGGGAPPSGGGRGWGPGRGGEAAEGRA